jgi:hypothetical protein
MELSLSNLIAAIVFVAVWIGFYVHRKNPRAKVGAIVATLGMIITYAIPTIASSLGLSGVLMEMTMILFGYKEGIELGLVHVAIFCAVYGLFYIETNTARQS